MREMNERDCLAYAVSFSGNVNDGKLQVNFRQGRVAKCLVQQSLRAHTQSSLTIMYHQGNC